MPLCKLCKKDRDLRESHFLPAAVYAQLRDGDRQNPNPVLVTSRISLTTSRQITGRVLCAECEDRFSKLGEAWVLANMARPEGFRIQEAVAATKPIGASEEFAYYSSVAIPEINGCSCLLCAECFLESIGPYMEECVGPNGRPRSRTVRRAGSAVLARGCVSCGHSHSGLCVADGGCVASSLYAAPRQGSWLSRVQLSYSRLGIQASSREADTERTSRNLFAYFCREADILRDVDRVGHNGRFWEIGEHEPCLEGSPSACEILSTSSGQPPGAIPRGFSIKANKLENQPRP